MRKTIFGLMTALVMALAMSCASCKNTGKGGDADTIALNPVGPDFNADTAYALTQAQCDFGPRPMNTEAHDKCGAWIVEKFKQYGCEVAEQKADLNGYDGTVLKATNIVARYNPQATTRVLLCAHWDSRPWADNDPDSANHRKPIIAANDAASGVAVMLEVARLLQQDKTLKIGVDFVCFDAEDWGFPEWETEMQDPGNTFALGAEYFASNLPQGYEVRYGILLDMVGGEDAQFYQEYMSKQYAPDIVTKVWRAAQACGHGDYFPASEGGAITDDHIPLNKDAKIATIDIIPFYSDSQNCFGPTWHTLADNMEHIDKATLKAVGQTMIQVLYSEEVQ